MHLKQYLEAKNLAGNEFAELCGVDAATISRIARGLQWPSRRVATRISKAVTREHSWDHWVDQFGDPRAAD